MKPLGRRVRNALAVVAILAALIGAYWIGYRAGLSDQGPDFRALVVVRRTQGDPNSSGSSATWFDIRKPRDAARLRAEEERLKAIGAEYYVAKARVERTMGPEPDPRHVNSHK